MQPLPDYELVSRGMLALAPCDVKARLRELGEFSILVLSAGQQPTAPALKMASKSVLSKQLAAAQTMLHRRLGCLEGGGQALLSFFASTLLGRRFGPIAAFDPLTCPFT